MEYRHYNTGDQVWVRRLTDGQEVTVKCITHDGMIWDEDQDTLLQTRRLTGMEYYANWVVVKAIQFVHWVMNA